MNEREVAELRRRFKADKSNITHVCGCYVNESKEIISEFDQSLATLSEEESEKLLSILRRTLSGALGRNLLDITFETKQVVEGAEHRLLMSLRSSALKDKEALQTFFQHAIQSLDLEGNYLILLAYDSYDVPYRAKDGSRQEDASSDVFTYLLCSVCPVKQTKPALSYSAQENLFHDLKVDWVVAPPETGFLFPAFDERSTNLYNALFYTKNAAETHPDFVDAIFRREAPMAAAVQMETFQAVLGESLAEECSCQVVQRVHDHLYSMMEEHKASKDPEPLAISKDAVTQVLASCGVEEGHVERFEQQYDQSFGDDAWLNPRNLLDTRQIEIKTNDVTIRVDAARSDLVETRVIDGSRYILVRAEDEVLMDGVPIHIS